jgi:putative membrane protein
MRESKLSSRLSNRLRGECCQMPGFIPTSRGSLMLDLVACAMIGVLPLLGLAIGFVKWKQNYALHKRLMLVMSSLLLVAVVLFEIEMRLIGWRHLAEASPYYHSLVPGTLVIHLICSISTVILLAVTVTAALKKFPKPPRPHDHSQLHRILGKSAALGLVMTSITGWIFYYVAFIAR